MSNYKITSGWSNGDYVQVFDESDTAQLIRIRRTDAQNRTRTVGYEVRTAHGVTVFKAAADAKRAFVAA